MTDAELLEALQQADYRTRSRISDACGVSPNMITRWAGRDVYANGRKPGFEEVAPWCKRAIEGALFTAPPAVTADRSSAQKRRRPKR